MKCSARRQKYQPQPQLHCPAFEPLLTVSLCGSTLAWAAPAIEAPVELRIESGHRLLGVLPSATVSAMPGGGFMAVEGGMQWQPHPQRGPTLAWWISGQIRLPAVGEVVVLTPD